MSLYNFLFGEHEEATVLLGMIGVTRENFKRYRDVQLNQEGDIITVLTRIGGGNRKDYADVFKQIKKNQYYIKNYDDNFDKTYCYFEFKVPEKYKEACKSMAPKEKPLTLKEKFDKEIEEMDKEGTDAARRANELTEQILNALANGDESMTV